MQQLRRHDHHNRENVHSVPSLESLKKIGVFWLNWSRSAQIITSTHLLLVTLGLLQFQSCVVDEPSKELLHPLRTEPLSLRHPQGPKDGGATPLQTHVHHRGCKTRTNHFTNESFRNKIYIYISLSCMCRLYRVFANSLGKQKGILQNNVS